MVSLLGEQCRLIHLSVSNSRMIVATDNIQKSVVRNCRMWAVFLAQTNPYNTKKELIIYTHPSLRPSHAGREPPQSVYLTLSCIPQLYPTTMTSPYITQQPP